VLIPARMRRSWPDRPARIAAGGLKPAYKVRVDLRVGGC